MIRENSQLKENLESVKGRIRDAAIRAGRSPDDVLLVGVTKTVRPDIMRNAYDLGLVISAKTGFRSSSGRPILLTGNAAGILSDVCRPTR